MEMARAEEQKQASEALEIPCRYQDASGRASMIDMVIYETVFDSCDTSISNSLAL